MPGRENDYIEIYKAKDGFRWRRWADNGNIVAESGEGYIAPGDATEMAKEVNPNVEIRIRGDVLVDGK